MEDPQPELASIPKGNPETIAIETIKAKIEALRAAEKNSGEQLEKLNQEEAASQQQFQQLRSDLMKGMIRAQGAVAVLEGLLPEPDNGKEA